MTGFNGLIGCSGDRIFLFVFLGFELGIHWGRPDLNQRSPAPEAGIIPN